MPDLFEFRFEGAGLRRFRVMADRWRGRRLAERAGRATREAAEEVAPDIAAAAPVATGELAGSVRVHGPRRSHLELELLESESFSMVTTVGPEAEHARYVARGTQHMDAIPFVDTTVEEHADDVVRRMVEELTHGS